MTPEVKAALEHVRSIFPDVTSVTYDNYGQWLYTTDNGEVPEFDDRVNIGILEDAADSVEHTPVTFHV